MTTLQGGPAQPVYIIDDSDLVENGGNFKVIGRVAVAMTGGGGVEEAPNDGRRYIRQNRTWQELSIVGKIYASHVVDAAGDGDFTTLSDAIAAANSGETIFVRRGTYVGGVTINKSLTIVGESEVGVVIQSPLSLTPAIIIAANDVTICSLTIDGRRASQSGTGSHLNFVGIRVDSGVRTVIRDLHIKNTLGNGITFVSGSGADSLIENCHIENIATSGSSPTLQAVLAGIQVFGAAARRLKIVGNLVRGWSQGIGLLDGANHCLVTENTIVNNYGYWNLPNGTSSAVRDSGSTTVEHGANVWENNVIDGSTSYCIQCGPGVKESQFINNICRNYNKFGDNTGGIAAIIDGGPSERTENILVAANLFYGHNVGGNFAVRGIGVTIKNNYFFDFTHSSLTEVIIVSGAVNNNLLIAENVFTNCRGGVLTEDNVPNGIQILANRWRSPIAGSLRLIHVRAGGQFVIGGNIMAGAANVKGIEISAIGGDGHRIINNVMLGFTTWCIDIRRHHNLVVGNYLTTTSTVGVIQLDGANYNTVTNNYCDPTGNARAIQLVNNGAYNVIQQNMFVGATTVVRDQTAGVDWPTTNGNITTPNDRSTLTYRIPLTGRSLGSQTVGTTQVTIAHGLPWTPREVRITMTSAGTIWQSAAADGTNIYLTADNAGRTANVVVI